LGRDADIAARVSENATCADNVSAPETTRVGLFLVLRNAKIATLWLARKLVLGTVNSGLASLAAAALAPIERRRSLFLEGMLSQLRRRNDPHSRFWSSAAGLYPDDPSFLRMKIHAALRIGDADAADAALTQLIALRKAGPEDARFVVGLTNVDSHSGRAARLRARVRCFLFGLRGSAEYRTAAVRLSRLVFAHFPRTGWPADRSRTQFLRMVDRSDLRSGPKRLLHRVAACERRLEQAYPGSLLSTDICSGEARAFVARVRNAVLRQTPFSFVRLGDGEAACLPYEPQLAAFAMLDAKERERIWWGAPLEREVRARIYPRLARAIYDADCIGIPTVGRFLRELRLSRNDRLETSLTGRGLRAVLHCVENWERSRSPDTLRPFFASCHLHQELELWNCYGELFEGMKEIVLVSCHQGLGDWMEQRFHTKIAGHVLLPPDRVTAPYLAQSGNGPNLPTVLDEAIAGLGELPRNRLVLVGGGLLGKLLVTEARAHGGIALDVGSIFDHWLGLRTRSYLDLNAA